MAPSYQQLLEMSDDELIAIHDRLAENTVLGVNYFLEELRRRALDRQTQRLVELTVAIKRLTWVITALTIVSAVLTLLDA
jgi:hypothetical protein